MTDRDPVSDARALLRDAPRRCGLCGMEHHAPGILRSGTPPFEQDHHLDCPKAKVHRLLAALCDEVERAREDARLRQLAFENELGHLNRAEIHIAELTAERDALLARQETLVREGYGAGVARGTLAAAGLAVGEMQADEDATVARLLGQSADPPQGPGEEGGAP